MDSQHGFGALAWPLREKEETVYREECIYTPCCTAIALQSIHLFQSLLWKHCIFSPTTPADIAMFSLQIYIE